MSTHLLFALAFCVSPQGTATAPKPLADELRAACEDFRNARAPSG